MKKTILAFLLAFCMIFTCLLASCGDDNKDESKEAASSSQETSEQSIEESKTEASAEESIEESSEETVSALKAEAIENNVQFLAKTLSSSVRKLSESSDLINIISNNPKACKFSISSDDVTIDVFASSGRYFLSTVLGNTPLAASYVDGNITFELPDMKPTSISIEKLFDFLPKLLSETIFGSMLFGDNNLFADTLDTPDNLPESISSVNADDIIALINLIYEKINYEVKQEKINDVDAIVCTYTIDEEIIYAVLTEIQSILNSSSALKSALTMLSSLTGGSELTQIMSMLINIDIPAFLKEMEFDCDLVFSYAVNAKTELPLNISGSVDASLMQDGAKEPFSFSFNISFPESFSLFDNYSISISAETGTEKTDVSLEWNASDSEDETKIDVVLIIDENGQKSENNLAAFLYNKKTSDFSLNFNETDVSGKITYSGKFTYDKNSFELTIYANNPNDSDITLSYSNNAEFPKINQAESKVETYEDFETLFLTIVLSVFTI